jgi:hypothetical protein
VDDTSPAIAARMVELYRGMSPSQKLQRVWQLTQMTHQVALAEIARRHPDESARSHRLRLASRYLPADLMLRAFGWDAVAKGY